MQRGNCASVTMCCAEQSMQVRLTSCHGLLQPVFELSTDVVLEQMRQVCITGKGLCSSKRDRICASIATHLTHLLECVSYVFRANHAREAYPGVMNCYSCQKALLRVSMAANDKQVFASQQPHQHTAQGPHVMHACVYQGGWVPLGCVGLHHFRTGEGWRDAHVQGQFITSPCSR